LPQGLFYYINMVIIVNGKEEQPGREPTLAEYLETRQLAQGSVVVERNGQIIPKDRYRLVTLREGDVLEIVRLVGGG